ncbi:MAG: RidA family protein [Halobacteria archaeon]
MAPAEKRLKELGLQLPPAPEPIAAYVPCVLTGNLLFVSAHIPKEGARMLYRGQVGADLTPEQGAEAAKVALLNALASVKKALGSLDRVKRVVKLTGFVASAPGFNDQPRVVNGASRLLIDLFGERGKHARAAVGVAELAMDSPVYIEMVLEVKE